MSSAAAVAGSSIDNFNETNTSAWVAFADKASTISTVRAADHADSSGASLQMDYNVAAGGYAGVERAFQPHADWSSITAMNLWVNGKATGHSFLVQVYDAGQERWEAHFTVDFTGWKQVTIPFSSFKAAAWQPPEATANGVLDLNGVTGVALVPSEAQGSGSVAVDDLNLGPGATDSGSTTTATPASTTMPAPAPTTTAAAPTATAPTTTSTTTAKPAATTPTPATTPTATSATPAPTATPSATSAQAAPAAAPASNGTVGATGVNGTIVPLYTPPTDASWDAVAAAKQAHPTVPVIAVINPASGPGSAVQPSYTSGIAKLTAAGVKVLGYVHTSYGSRAAADVQTDMNNWHGWYPGVTGIFFDEMAKDAGQEAYYTAQTAYAKGHGFDFTVGNPGLDTTAGYVGTVDVILIYENGGVPAVSAISGWHTAYPRQNFGVIPYRVSAVDTAFISAARQYVGYIYLSSDDLPNPWDSVPSYLSSLLGALQ